MTPSGIRREPDPIRLRLLGCIAVERVRNHPADIIALQPKRLALLGYLAAAGGTSHRRDTIVGLFWPDLDAERARGALNKALHYLRRSLGEGVIVSRGEEELGLDPERVWCDVTAFTTSLAAGRYAEALSHYGGELLPGLFLSNAPEWERWLDARRMALRGQARDAAWALATAAESAGEAVAAASWTRQALSLATDDETVLRRAIELLERVGDRTGGLRAYDDFARRLADEYDTEPAPETRALIARIRTAAPAALASSEASSPASRHSAAQLPAALAAASSVAEAVEKGPPFPPHSSPDSDAVPARSAVGRARSRRTSALALATLAVLLAVVQVVRLRGADAAAVEGLSARRIVVAPFENRTGEPRYDVVGQWAADWVLQGLSQSGSIELVPVTATLTSVRYVLTTPDALDSAARLAAIARETGAGIAVAGSYYRQGDSLHFSARATDVARGDVLLALDPIAAPLDRPLTAVEELRRRILAGLAPLLDARMADYARIASRPPSLEAFHAYADGVDRFLAADWRAAVELFATAHARDSSYTLPLVMQAIAWANLGQYARVDSLAAMLAPVRDQLPEYDRLAITAAAAWSRGDYATSYEAAVRAGQLAPNTIAHSQVAAEALALNRPREARDLLLSLDPYRGELRGWIMYWLNLGEAHHALGAYRRELDVAERTLALHPMAPGARTLHMRALAALRRDADVLTAARQLIADDVPGAANVLHTAARELHAHGRREAARELLELTLSWQQRQDTSSVAARRARAETLYLLGQRPPSRELFRALADELPNSLPVQGRLATLAALDADDEVSTLELTLANRSEPFLHGANTMWRARVAALRGDSDDALVLLRRAYAEGRWGRIDLHADPDLASLRPLREFRALAGPSR